MRRNSPSSFLAKEWAIGPWKVQVSSGLCLAILVSAGLTFFKVKEEIT